jgi:hypothetical protein
MSEFYEFLKVEVSGLLRKWRAQRGRSGRTTVAPTSQASAITKGSAAGR